MTARTLRRMLAAAFAAALLTTALLVGVQTLNTPIASASYIGDPLTGCGTSTATMKATVKNSLGQRLLTVKMAREWDWCRMLHCEYFRPTPCYWGAAPISSTVLARPSISTTNLAIGWSLVLDSITGQWKDRREGGDWGWHSEHDSYAQFHLVQCIDVWLVHQCSTRRSYSWKLVVDGSGQAHGNYKWGG